MQKEHGTPVEISELQEGEFFHFFSDKGIEPIIWTVKEKKGHEVIIETIHIQGRSSERRADSFLQAVRISEEEIRKKMAKKIRS